MLAAMLVLLVLAGTVGTDLARQHFGAPAALVELREEYARAQEELQAARVELDVERATHTELQRHVIELQEQVGDLNQQLEFLSSRTAQAAGKP
jgi:predicted  nucleic acid-binding Zn-ribbon protein